MRKLDMGSPTTHTGFEGPPDPLAGLPNGPAEYWIDLGTGRWARSDESARSEWFETRVGIHYGPSEEAMRDHAAISARWIDDAMSLVRKRAIDREAGISGDLLEMSPDDTWSYVTA